MLKTICLWLTIIGGLNWGLVGIFDFNLVGLLFGGNMSYLARIIYTLVGISSAYIIVDSFRPKED